MRGLVRLLTGVAAIAGLLSLGCGAIREISPSNSDRAAGIAKKIGDARSMDAEECAPKELAWAEASLDLARHEAMEYESAAYIERHFAAADERADALLAKAKPCYEAKMRETADSDGDGVPDYKDKCPGTARGATVDDRGCAVDSDGDGVADHADKCPGTVRGATVDSRGCAVDSDGDGVADHADKCPNTARGATVDSRGCAVDSDGDGVADHADQCPDTVRGARVDSRGCAVDSDGDGVADHADKCPDTVRGAKVDSRGCVVDSDGDGVANVDDRCPDTPRGAPVDGEGCLLDSDGDGLTDWDETQKYGTNPNRADTDGGGVNDGLEVNVAGTDPNNPADDVKEVARAELEIFFASNSDVVSGASDADIKKVADFLAQYPSVHAVIEGHTDDRGAAAYNLDLSLRRAQSVADILVDRYGVDPTRVMAKGYGEAKPIASNDTAEGRARNRRIFAVLESD